MLGHTVSLTSSGRAWKEKIRIHCITKGQAVHMNQCRDLFVSSCVMQLRMAAWMMTCGGWYECSDAFHRKVLLARCYSKGHAAAVDYLLSVGANVSRQFFDVQMITGFVVLG
jgi:hypothetical protein